MSTIFDKVPLAPEDAVFGLAAQCSADPNPNKVNLVIGAYRDEDLKPWVLPVVRQVQTQLATDPVQNHEYLAIDGSPVRRTCYLCGEIYSFQNFRLGLVLFLRL